MGIEVSRKEVLSNLTKFRANLANKSHKKRSSEEKRSYTVLLNQKTGDMSFDQKLSITSTKKPNQTLRVAHYAMSKLLKQLKNASSLSEIKEELSSMEDIFHLQETYAIQKQEQSIKENLKKLGYIN